MKLSDFLQLHQHNPATDKENIYAVRELFNQGKLTEAFKYAQRARLCPVWVNTPSIVKHPVLRHGTRSTHIPDEPGTLLECRADTSAVLEQFLTDRGLVRKTPVPELTSRSLSRVPSAVKKVLPRRSKCPSRANIEVALNGWFKEQNPEIFVMAFDYATAKAEGNLFEFSDVQTSPEECGIEVANTVFEEIGNFDQKRGKFFSWLARISYVTSTKAFNAHIEDKKKRVPLELPNADGETVRDNPALYRDEKPTVARTLPNSIQGVDRYICDLIREGLDYGQIADALQMTENAVKQRIKRIRTTQIEV